MAEQMYSTNGRSLKALALLSLGLKNDDGSPVFNTSILPWSAALRPSALKMTAKELRREILRRCVAAGNVLHAPRPNQWPVPKSTEWLESNPIVDDNEVAFIRATISHRITVAKRMVIHMADPQVVNNQLITDTIFREIARHRNAPPNESNQLALPYSAEDCCYLTQHIRPADSSCDICLCQTLAEQVVQHLILQCKNCAALPMQSQGQQP
jgi:hypothetical protein